MRPYVLVALLLTGCTTTVNAVVQPAPSAAPKASAAPAAAAMPEPGSQVDQAFWKAHHPKVVKGQTWTYTSANVNNARPGDETPFETVMALTDVGAATLTFRVTGEKAETVEGAVGPLVPGPDPAWTYFGNEDVTVPAGTFKGALKLIAATAINAGEVRQGGEIWLVPDTGVVKFKTNGEAYLRHELKAVSKP